MQRSGWDRGGGGGCCEGGGGSGVVAYGSQMRLGEELQMGANDEHRSVLSWEPCRALVVGGTNGELFQCQGEWAGSLQISVELDKPLTWDRDKREWRWHKTWRLPEICVRVADAKMLPNLEVRLSVVCVGSNSNELNDVGLSTPDGSQRCVVSQLVDSECRFSRLRLLGTSNTHGGRRFHFLLSVVQKDSLGSQQVLASLISSAFSVYSRKDADKKRKKADAEGAGDDTSNAFQPFAPELFTRTFVKKVSDHNGRTLEETIDNHWTGLMRYFQAPNIRFKSRHPLLLAARFSNVVVILRDCNHFPEMDEAAIRAFLCACNFPPNCRSSDCLSCYQRQIQQMGGLDKGDGGSLALWYISMRRNLSCPLEAKRWLSEHLSCVKSDMIGFIQDPSMLPAQYVETDNVPDIQNLYIKLYALEYSAKKDSTTGGKSMRMQKSSSNLGLPQSMLSKQVPVPRKEEHEPMVGSLLNNAFDPEDLLAGAGLEREPSSSKTQFAEFFYGLHKELRNLLNIFTGASSMIVTDLSEENIQRLRDAYFNFTEALSVHSHMQNTTLFPELMKRVPGVTEAYSLDHYKEIGQLTRIYEAINSIDAKDAAELFLSISEFAALDRVHMEKEEEHLLPYFLRVFSDAELTELMQKAYASARNMSSEVDAEE